jgi:hypothetical protein
MQKVKLLFLILAAPIFAHSDTRYFTEASVYFGVDYPVKIGHSPQCPPYEDDNRINATAGAKLKIVESDWASFNARYSHASCLLSKDYNMYDAFGVEVEIPIFKR